MSGNKTRAALILVEDTYDITVAYITSKIVKHEANDIELKPSGFNGLKVDSFIKLNKLATVDKSLAIGKLGELRDSELGEVDNALIKVFRINYYR